MKLAVVGATGRMGRTLLRAVNEADGVVLSGAVDRAGAAELGMDSGVLAGLGENGVPVTDDALAVFAKSDGVIDFTIPAASVAYSELAAQARIVHVIGTTGCSNED
ncbi:MAG: 4-hydroxy-tetrahydrodipicolinate reductase, partial [Pseudomonadota bacterium]